MITQQSVMITRDQQSAPTGDTVRAAAQRLYDAECALHTAHQTHIDAWINAANNKHADADADADADVDVDVDYHRAIGSDLTGSDTPPPATECR
ncbi:hypothetical protein SAMN05892883_4237 [Jatrophihabitans sp. GAS493]|uniref:hypothetical protein n=1 Tax=Jatrophihabitans sp. GAS493 TaxID=1907575 RepID=UPI000BB8B776|nr:hypothetical protein [Jatrophihabitans sp. GAS493]SOD75036.1 hypothetical protein SAMN05892883_4237 [Jatrophihabitans sp. GAS493]